MKHDLTADTPNQTQAKALLAEINGAQARIIPRRETIVEWLNAFLLRSDKRGYEMGPTEADDLTALDQYLRGYLTPLSAGPAL